MMRTYFQATPGRRWVGVIVIGVGTFGCSREQPVAGALAPALVEVPYASVAASETWDKLSFDVTMDAAPLGTRFKAPVRSITLRVAREMEVGRGWKTVIDLASGPDDRPGSTRARTPARIHAYDDGRRTLVNEQGQELPARLPTPKWPPVKKVTGAKSYTELAGIAGPSSAPPSFGNSGGGRKWADFLLVGPGTKGRLLGAIKKGAAKSAGESKVQLSSSHDGIRTEVVVDTASGRIEEIRGTMPDGSRNVAKNFFMLQPSGVGHLSRTEHVAFNKAGAEIGRVVVTYSNIKTLQSVSGGDS